MTDDNAMTGDTTEIDTVLVYNLLRTHASLTPHVDRGLRDLSLTGAQFNTLLLLRDAGVEGLPLSEVGRRLIVTRANVTGLVDRLERLDYVRRDTTNDPDRRVIRARLTERGRALIEEALPRHRAILTRVLQGVTDEEKGILIGLLTRLRRGLREAERKDADNGAIGAGT